MISISAIKTYMYCPLKLYFQKKVDEAKDDDEYFVSKTLKELRIDIQDLLQRNMRNIKKGMALSEIEKILKKDITNQIESTFNVLEELCEENGEKIKDVENKDDVKNKEDEEYYDKKENSKENSEKIQLEEISKLKEEIYEESFFKTKLLALKISQSTNVLDKDGDEVQSIYFPNCMYNYLIRDKELDLIGVVDKIEVIKGNYFPISLKSSNPPFNGVWDNDTMEVVADALLIEQEFDTHITIGFIDYLKIDERRPVIIDAKLRKKFFKAITNINRIVEKGEIPSVKMNLNKCKNCEYKELCENK